MTVEIRWVEFLILVVVVVELLKVDFLVMEHLLELVVLVQHLPSPEHQ